MKKLDLTKSALMVIDMQRYFLEEAADAYLDPPKSLLQNVLKLIEAFREMYKPIVFSRHAHKRSDPPGQMSKWWDNKLPWEDEEQSKLVDEIKPATGEIFITKTRYSAFEGNELDSRLKREGIGTVVICGVMTNLCVETTARQAFMKDLQPVVVEDACASSSHDFHKAAITNLEYGFAFIEKTNSILKQLRSKKT